MPSIDRPLSGDVMVFDLAAERGTVEDSSTAHRAGRSARTLLKDGPLRVTLVILEPGGEVAEHHASGPMTLQPLDGRITFLAGGEAHEVGPGELLTAGPGVPHQVRSREGGAFLLTVVNEPASPPA